MLQPHQPTAEQQLMTARIIWAALTMSMIIYGFVLFSTGQLTRVEELSQIPNQFQLMGIFGNVIALGVFYLFKNKVQTEPDFQKRFPLYIVCWALNESIVLLGFVSVFLTGDGNGLLYVTNLMVGLVANAICFPKK